VITSFGQDGDSRIEACLSKMENMGIKLKVVMRCESPDLVRKFVRQGMGVGILYSNAIKHAIKAGRLKDLEIPGLESAGKNYIVHRKDKPISRLAREFLNFLRSSASKADPVKPARQPRLNSNRTGEARPTALG
jgi:DNA-binding transcriptional LysR family regulator